MSTDRRACERLSFSHTESCSRQSSRNVIAGSTRIACNAGTAVAATATGTPTAYAKQPYFFTDQYDLGMEYRGYIPPGVEPTVVIRGDRENHKLLAFWLSPQGQVLAGMNVNIWDAADQINALMNAGPVDPRRLADPGTPLEEAAR